MSLPLHDMVVIVGAGISRDAPTNAAGFADIRDRFLRAAGIEEKLLPDTDNLSPEQIFEALDDKRKSTCEAIQRDLWWLCETGAPNLNHHAVVDLIQAGAKVWTPNFDNMIERAAGDRGGIETVFKEPDRIRPGLVLMKPHGSFPLEPCDQEPRRHDYRLLFQTSAVWNLDVDWRKRLEEDCAGRDVFLFGYRGADPDLTPAILLALAGARSAIWWECDLENLPRLVDLTSQIAVDIRDGNPSTALRNLAHSRAGFDPESVQLVHRPGPSGADYELRYRPSFESRAGLAGLVQGAGKARWLRLRGLVSPRSSGSRKPMAYRLLRSAGFDWPAAKPPLRLALTLALRRPDLSSERREFLAANYLMLIDSAPLRRSDVRAVDRLRRSGLTGTTAVDVRFASIAKLRGDLRGARADAERAMANAGNDVLHEAMAVYNLAWIYRQMAEFVARRDLLHGYRDRRAHIGPNWAAWLAIDNALLALHFGDPVAAGDQMNSPLAKFSRGTVNHPAYVQDDRIARALITWHSSDPSGARSELEASLADRPTRRLRPALFSSLTTQILLADHARGQGDLDLMASWLRKARSRSRSTLQQVQIKLVYAYATEDVDDLNAIEREANRRGFGLIATTAASALSDKGGRLVIRPDLPLPALY